MHLSVNSMFYVKDAEFYSTSICYIFIKATFVQSLYALWFKQFKKKSLTQQSFITLKKQIILSYVKLHVLYGLCFKHFLE